MNLAPRPADPMQQPEPRHRVPRVGVGQHGRGQRHDEQPARDLRQRRENKGALPHAPVRNGETGPVERHVVIEENVEVEDARTPAQAGGAAGRALDLFESREQVGGPERRLDQHAGVEERRLIDDAPRRRAPKG